MVKLHDGTPFDLQDVKFGVVGEDGQFIESRTLSPAVNASGVPFNIVDKPIDVISTLGSSIFEFELAGEPAQQLLDMLMLPWGYVVFSPKDGKPAVRAMVFAQEDARRMLDGETIEVMWQRFENHEWVNVERAPLQISLPHQYVWELPTTIPFRPDRVVFGSKADADGFLTGETVPGTWQKFDGENWIDGWSSMFRFNRFGGGVDTP